MSGIYGPNHDYHSLHLQVDDEVGFIKFFRGLPVKDEETIRIFDRGDWYTAHGEDASFIARTVRRWLLESLEISVG